MNYMKYQNYSPEIYYLAYYKPCKTCCISDNESGRKYNRYYYGTSCKRVDCIITHLLVPQ